VIPAKSGDVTSAEATDVGSAETADAATTKTTDVTSTKTADVAATEAAHVAAAKAATMSATATAAATGFCTGGDKAAGKQHARQDHCQSSSHHILHWIGADTPPWDLDPMSARLGRTNADVAMIWRWEFSSAVSIKFAVSRRAHANKEWQDQRPGLKQREARTRSRPRNPDRSLS
jgi:hypothetical protein